MKIDAKFCHVCGAKLVMRYPGNDPENGPAGLRCKDDAHTPIQEIVQDAVMAKVQEGFQDVLEEISCGGTDPHMQPSASVKLAAALLLEWDLHVGLQYDRLYREVGDEDAEVMFRVEQDEEAFGG